MKILFYIDQTIETRAIIAELDRQIENVYTPGDLNKLYDNIIEFQADFVFICESLITPPIVSALNDCNINVIIYGILDHGIKNSLVYIPTHYKGKLDIDDSKVLYMQNFADTNNYCIGNKIYKLESDIVFSTNVGPVIASVANDIFNSTQYNIKVAGAYNISIPCYIGDATLEEFMSLCKSTKVVVTDNINEKYSLLCYNICAITLDQIDDMSKYIDSEKIRKQYINENKNKILSEYTIRHEILKLIEKITT